MLTDKTADHFALLQQEVKELINKAEVSEVLNTQTQMVFLLEPMCED